MKQINTEINNARNGKEAYILLKLNSLVDPDMIKKLYQASKAGVKIRMIVRGICSLIPGKKDLSENMEAISIVDRFLEHSRIYIFCNGGDEKYYISSADWMTRNLDHRSETACPVYDKDLKRELRDFFEIQFSDNVKARILEAGQKNQYKRNTKKSVRSQEEIMTWLAQKNTTAVIA